MGYREPLDLGSMPDHAWLPADAWRSLTFKVYPKAAFPSGRQYPPDYIGYSVDRRVRELTDAELAGNVRDGKVTVQVGQVRRDDGTLCDHVGIFQAGIEYPVAPVFLDADGLPRTSAGRSIWTGLDGPGRFPGSNRRGRYSIRAGADNESLGRRLDASARR